jgi:hypothetical protein
MLLRQIYAAYKNKRYVALHVKCPKLHSSKRTFVTQFLSFSKFCGKMLYKL